MRYVYVLGLCGIVLSGLGIMFMKGVHKWMSPGRSLSREEWLKVERHMGASVLKPPQLTQAQIDQYHELGYVKIANYFDEDLVEAMRTLVDWLNKNPSGLLKKANKGRFCGFLIHAFETVPEWRDLTLRLPLPETISTLLGTESVMYAQDIIHTTYDECFPENVNVTTGRMHSDGNQGAFSLNKKYNWGDNLAISWIALDKLDHIDFQVYPRSHKWIDPYGNFTFDNFCRMDHDVRSLENDHTFETVRVHMNPGDVLFFQGLTYHAVSKHRECEIDTCRRVTIRYVDGEVTSWRDDLQVNSVWPFISWATRWHRKLGEQMETTLPGPYMLDRRMGSDVKLGLLRYGGSLIPPIHHWLRFAFRIFMSGGMKGDHIVSQCPHNVNLARSQAV